MKKLLLILTLGFVMIVSSLSASASLSQFIGEWTNIDPNTSGITKLTIAEEVICKKTPIQSSLDGKTYTQMETECSSVKKVHPWGKCTPADCDWGAVEPTIFSPSDSSDLDPNDAASVMIAIFKKDGGKTTMIMRPGKESNRLKVVAFNQYDDSKLRNYESEYTLERIIQDPHLGLASLAAALSKPPEEQPKVEISKIDYVAQPDTMQSMKKV